MITTLLAAPITEGKLCWGQTKAAGEIGAHNNVERTVLPLFKRKDPDWGVRVGCTKFERS